MADLKHRITVLFINLFLGGYAGQEEIEFEDHQDKVYIFEGKLAGGMSFWWNKILMQEDLFKKKYETAREYVYLHELGHRQESGILGLANGFFQWTLHPSIVLVELIFISGAIVSYFILIPNESLVDILRLGALISIAHIPTAVTVSWALETLPDLFVIEKIGEERFEEGIEVLRELYSDRSLASRIFSRLTHPTPEFVIKIARLKSTSS